MHSAAPPPPAGNRAVLLLGPTGSGKTPLGEMIEQRGLWHTRCLHFDFGANLRETVARGRPDELISRHDTRANVAVAKPAAKAADGLAAAFAG